MLATEAKPNSIQFDSPIKPNARKVEGDRSFQRGSNSAEETKKQLIFAWNCSDYGAKQVQR